MQSAIVPRDLDVDFTDVPRKWCADNAAATGISNGVNLLFPAGERFFVRSVKHYQSRIDDPQLRADIKGFFGQEGRHAREHDRLNEILRQQGYQIDEFLEQYEKISRWIEDRASPQVRLAVTAAAEHFTAILAEGAFEQGILDGCDERMQQLLGWHAAEELEHKSVAFDVLQQVDGRYRTRVIGLALATVLLGGFWFWAATVLLKQDGLTWRSAIKSLRTLPRQNPIIRRVFVRGIKMYLKRDFHPAKHDTTTMAERWFASRNFGLPEAA